MMKKFCFLLAVLVMISCLSGCGEKNTNATTELKRTSEEKKENPVTLSKLENAFCDDNEKFSISGTTATHNRNGRYNRVITAEVSEENKISSIRIEYTDLNTKAYKSSEILSKFLKDDTGELSAGNVLSLLPLYDLRDMIMLVGAKDSEITIKLMMDIIENGASFTKNDWSVQVSIGDDCVSFVANYGA